MMSTPSSRQTARQMLECEEGPGEDIPDPHSAASDADTTTEATPVHKIDHPTICGMDKRPFFPVALFALLIWTLFMTTLHKSWFLGLLHGATLCAAFSTSLSNPGLANDDMEMPRRAGEHGFYARPVLRLHQYCRWVRNCIGLHNHRSYMVMLAGFVASAASSALVDLLLIVTCGREAWATCILLAHAVCSTGLLWYSAPLLRLHSSFVSRNELAQEWKRDDFWIVRDEETGAAVSTRDLDVDTWNRHYDADEFEYDPSLNRFDNGWWNNCMVFWLTPRSDGTLGEF